MKALLTMRGCDKKKHTEAWSQGTLRISRGELKLQGTSHKWRTAAGRGEPWFGANESPVRTHQGMSHRPSEAQKPTGLCRSEAEQPHTDARLDTQLVAAQKDDPRGEARPRANVHGLMPLKDICCAICGHCQKVGGLKLRTSTGFSMIKCRNPNAKRCNAARDGTAAATLSGPSALGTS